MSRIFRKLHYYFFRCRYYFTFLPCKQQSDELPIKLGPYFARRQTPSKLHARSRHQRLLPADCINTAIVSDVSWVVDCDLIIASVLRIICRRCFPYYSPDALLSGYEMAKPPLKKWRRRENASLPTIGGEILLG